jgi:prepilin-type N-terminal cleavage/methylation domain-containing protein
MRTNPSQPPRLPWAAPGRRARGFTLFEIMMVLAILLIIVGIGLPAMISTVRKGPMRQALADLEEGFLRARMLAILTGLPAELVIHAADGTLTLRPVSEGAAASTDEDSPARPMGLGEEFGEATGSRNRSTPEELPKFSAKLDDSVAFKQLTVSLRDVMDETEAAVRFYPNGTCDALTALLVSEAGQERALTLEITTGRMGLEVIR